MKRILMFMLILLGLVSGVNAYTNSDVIAFWDFQDFNDKTTNGHDLTQNGGSLVTAINGTGLQFTGTNGQYAYINDHNDFDINKDFTVCYYQKFTSLVSTSRIIHKADNTFYTYSFFGYYNYGGFAYDSGDNLLQYENGVGLNTGVFEFICFMRYSNGNTSIYRDGNSIFSSSTYTTDWKNGNGILSIGGGAAGSIGTINGIVDQVSYFSKALSQDEVNTLYSAEGNPIVIAAAVPVLEFNNITGNSVTLVNDTYYNDTIQFQTFVTNTSTNGNVNHSYSLNGSAYTQYTINSLTGTVNLTLSDGVYNISFYAENNETNVTSSNYSFIVDTTNPIFTDPLNGTEINSYIFNVTTLTCTDTNLDYCNITIEGTEYDLLTTDTITLTINGNSSYSLSSGDLAGNTNTSTGYVFVNPYQYFYFQKEGSPVVNFTFAGVEFTDYAFFKTYNDNISLGSNSFVWAKTGYATQTINFTVTNTSNINNTYNVTLATIFINIYDKDTGSFVTGTTTVEFISTIGLKTNTSNGTLEITNSLFQAETYTIVVTNPTYISENVYFTFTNVENVEINVYMTLNTSTNAGIIPVRVLDNFGQPVQGAAVFAKQWFSASSSFVTTSQALTDISGKAQLNVLLNDKVYVLSASYGSASVESIQQTFYTSNTESEIILTLIPGVTENQIYFLYNIISSATESFNEETNVSTISFTWEDTNNEGATGCINTYRSINGQVTKINTDPLDCTTAAATTLVRAYTLNTSQDIVFRAEMLVDGKYYPVKSFVHNSEQNPASFLKTIGLDLMVVPILFILCIVIGIASKNMYVGTFLMMVAAGLSLTIAPGILTSGVVAFCFVIGAIIMYGGTR